MNITFTIIIMDSTANKLDSGKNSIDIYTYIERDFLLPF